MQEQWRQRKKSKTIKKNKDKHIKTTMNKKRKEGRKQMHRHKKKYYRCCKEDKSEAREKKAGKKIIISITGMQTPQSTIREGKTEAEGRGKRRD